MYHLIYNPIAGRRRIPDALERVRSRIGGTGRELREFVTTAPGAARDYAASLPPEATILALGGDGTVQEVAGACVFSERVLGVLPAGSGDDFAFALGIDRHDLDAAVDRVLAGRVRIVDSGLANGRCFVNAAGSGFDADVARTALTAPWPLRERSAYLYAIFNTLARLTSIPVTLTLDGKIVHAGPALLVSAQNGPRSGGSFRLAPQALPDDGLLDVVVAGSFSRPATIGILPRVLAGTHLSDPRVRVVRGRHLIIEWEQPRPAHLEGELLAPCQRFDIELLPGSLRVLV